jgi:hypothetical protein
MTVANRILNQYAGAKPLWIVHKLHKVEANGWSHPGDPGRSCGEGQLYIVSVAAHGMAAAFRKASRGRVINKLTVSVLKRNAATSINTH